jgi:large-conductance mechanosensitive channel
MINIFIIDYYDAILHSLVNIIITPLLQKIVSFIHYFEEYH